MYNYTYNLSSPTYTTIFPYRPTHFRLYSLPTTRRNRTPYSLTSVETSTGLAGPLLVTMLPVLSMLITPTLVLMMQIPLTVRTGLIHTTTYGTISVWRTLPLLNLPLRLSQVSIIHCSRSLHCPAQRQCFPFAAQI